MRDAERVCAVCRHGIPAGLFAGMAGCGCVFLPEMEGDGVVYQDFAGAAIEDPRMWIAQQGVNLVRLRVWHNPSPNLRSSW